MNEPDISVTDVPLKKAWTKLIQYEDELDWPGECKMCKAQKVCFKCAGMLSAECGDPHHVPKEYCKKIIQYYEEIGE